MSDSTIYQGGCLCGAIRYELDRSAVLSSQTCYCRDCQRSTGSGSTTFCAAPLSAFNITSGELATHSVTGDSGGSVRRSFCPKCGSPIVSKASVADGLLFVKAGSLDDASWVAPNKVYYESSAQPWAPVVAIHESD